MILTTHALVGTSVAVLVPTNPALGFVAAILSHFLLDMIPHWDYKMSSVIQGSEKATTFIKKGFSSEVIKDVSKVLVDVLVGCVAVLLIFPITDASLPIIVAGIVGGLVPDGLQFLYMTGKFPSLRNLQKFQESIDTGIHIKSPVLGILLQMAIVVATIMIVSALHF